MALGRGIFICLEGIDGCGKSTQTLELHHALSKGYDDIVSLLKFPSRTGPIGSVIHEYLTSPDNSSSPMAFHHLCVADRWDQQDDIRRCLKLGRHVIADRYSSSGFAYSMAQGITQAQCARAESGIIKPDLTVYLRIDPLTAVSRIAGNGRAFERYEKADFLKKVDECFSLIRDDTWIEIDANLPQSDIAMKIYECAMHKFSNMQFAPIRYF